MRTLLLPLLAVSAFAQQAAPPSFDVASVKINSGATASPKMDINPGSVTMLNINLSWVIAWAYDVQRPQISGPDWLDSVRFDIVAKSDHPAKESEMQLMMRTLLEQRFKLAFHRETRPMDVMALLAPKSGTHKMTPSTSEAPKNRQDPERGMILEGIRLSELAEEITHDLKMPVVDQTGLAGRFDFSFNSQKYVQALRSRLIGEAHPPAEAELRILLMQDIVAGELGLRLESRNAPVELLILDHVERSPIEN